MVLSQEVASCRALIAADEARIAKQIAVITRLRRIGEETSMSERLLSNYEAALANHQRELRRYGPIVNFG